VSGFKGYGVSRNTGLTKRLREFFEANPGEELTQQDIAAKFGASPRTVANAICTLHKHGLLQRAVVYRLDREQGATTSPNAGAAA
jgi:DNA-binding GntR family transcriptional regulator